MHFNLDVQDFLQDVSRKQEYYKKIKKNLFKKELQDKLVVLNRKEDYLSKNEKKSKNCKKARLKLAKKHEKIYNQRKETLHKITKQLVFYNRAISFGIEDLNVIKND